MGLDQVLGDIRRDGEARAHATLAEARKQAQTILEAARKDAQAYEVARLAAAAKEATQAAAQVASRGESEARKIVLAEQATLRSAFKQQVLRDLAQLPAKTREKHLKSLAIQAHKAIPQGTVWGAAADQDALGTLKEFSYGGKLDIAGGLVVESSDGTARLDMSYETLLDSAWRDILRSEAKLFEA